MKLDCQHPLTQPSEVSCSSNTVATVTEFQEESFTVTRNSVSESGLGFDTITLCLLVEYGMVM